MSLSSNNISDLSSPKKSSKSSEEKENINVYLRLRPQNESEIMQSDSNIWEINENSVRVNYSGLWWSHKSIYSYNSWFGESSENEQIYQEAVRPIILSSFEGINGTVFMYGQTGSGKTYTMLGDYSKEIRENNLLAKRSNSRMRIRSGSRNTFHAGSSLQRNWSLATISNKTNFGSSLRGQTAGLQKQSSVGTPNGLPPKAAGLMTDRPSTASETNQNNVMNFEYYIRNWKQYNITPKKGGLPLTRNKSEGKLQTISTVQIDEDSNKGVLIYSLNEFFTEIDRIKNQNHESSLDGLSKEQGDNVTTNTFIIKWSYFEIYNDMVYDLLSDINEFDKPLIVWEDSKRRDFYVKGLKHIVIETLDECLDILKMGEFNRHYAATSMNHQSSRSHTIFRLFIQNIEHLYKDSEFYEGNYSVWKESILNFIDLAGSEKVSNHHNNKYDSHGTMMSDAMISSNIKERVKEGKHINKSLFFLTQVISMKAKGKSDHIPYRNSPLTKILRSSLGGNSRTSIILCATPTISQYEQTLSTMRFGFSAKQIENKIHANITKNSEEESLKAMICDYESKLKIFQDDREKISELQKQKQVLKERLQNVSKGLLLQPIRRGNRPEKNFEHAVVHWDGLGVLWSSVDVEHFWDTTKIGGGWKIASWEITRDEEFMNIIDQSYVRSIKKQNGELKKAAKETKKYAEKVIDENSNLKTQLEKANKKIKSIELAKGFEKCNDELLDKWEKIFTNWLIQVSKEKGKREAQREFKNFKFEFKKVITLNSNLQAQIEAISSNRLMLNTNPSNNPSEMQTPPHYSTNNDRKSIFNSSNSVFIEESSKENFNFYHTQTISSKPHDNLPPSFTRHSGSSDRDQLSSMLEEDSFSKSSSHEIENIIISNKFKKHRTTEERYGNFGF
jgi:hypothetical protein